MVDLYLGLAIMGGLAIAAFLLARRLAAAAPRWAGELAALATTMLLFWYIQFLWDDVRLARWLPFSNLVVVGNWFPVAAGMLAGLAWSKIPGSNARKSVSVAALTLAGGYSAVVPLLGAAPDCEDWWDAQQNCVQSTQQTCSPACAATLLAWHGIPATEQEMAELCLTRDGTTWLGLYRGLKLKTAGTPLQVEVAQCDADEVLALDSPAIVSVGLDASAMASELRREFGWIPGVNHTILFVRKNSAQGLTIVDPAPGYGRERWSRANFEMLFRGIAIRLVERS